MKRSARKLTLILALLLASVSPAMLMAAGTVTTPTTVTTTPTNPNVAPTYTATELPFDVSKTGSSESSTALGSLFVDSLADLGERDPVSITIGIVNILLTLLALGFLVQLMYAGVIWIQARGNEEEIGRSKNILKRSITGLAIILSAYGISYLIFTIIDQYVSAT